MNIKSLLFNLILSSLLVETTLLPHNLYVKAQILPKDQIKKLFKSKRIGHGRHEILPIELTITNADSIPCTLTLNRHKMDMPLASIKDLEKRLILTPRKYKSRILKIGTIFGAIGYTAWFLYDLPTILLIVTPGASGFGALFGFLSSWLFAEATIPLVAHKEELIQTSIRKHSLKPITTIQPYTTIKKLIYVQKKHYKPQFDLIFVNNNQESVINIDLEQNS